MKKNTVMGLLIIALIILVISGCGSAPPPASDPVTTTQQPEGGSLILEGAAYHTVVRGDTLADIAAVRYGGSNMYFFPLIRLANTSEVPDPDVIEVGQRLVVPDLQRNLNNNGAKALLKNDMLSVARQYEKQGKPAATSRLRNLADKI
ncbi:MAG: LysM peptidoglycan-binding domain-containing protein [Treponema sp.]|nr:LysM peptidoglycan-binding domain-containing protein [Treponema sp.]